MNPIAHYTPGIVVAGVLDIAGGMDSAVDWDDFLCVERLLIKLVARDLASAEAGVSLNGIEWRAGVRYYEDAPETEALVMRLLQAARTEWMRDPW